MATEGETIMRLRAERDRLAERCRGLEALVESAFREGWRHGLSDGHPLAVAYTSTERWEASDARDDLRALLPQTDTSEGGGDADR